MNRAAETSRFSLGPLMFWTLFPMQLAILSDIHANMEAFEAVLKDINTASIDTIISLGDNIGYGPEPEKVISCLKENNIPSVMGNHEYAILNKSQIESFNLAARLSILKTIEWLSEKAVSFVKQLPNFMIFNHCRFVHGAPPDSPTLYMYEALGVDYKGIFSLFDEHICFLGHTHKLDMVHFDGHKAHRKKLFRGKFKLEKHNRYVINVGSVGQPRDDDKHAKYVIWDMDEHLIDVRFIEYDVTGVAEKIKAAGLPLANAERLW